MPSSRSQRAAQAAGAVLGAAAVYARVVEPRRLRLPTHELRLPRWPAELDGVQVAVMSDLHAGGPHTGLRRVRRIVDAVNAAGPDLVALCGDYVDPLVPGGGRLDPRAVADELARLSAPAAAVLGNHDWEHEGERMRDALANAGVPVLENRAVRLAVRGEPLWVAGLADERERDPRPGEALADVPPDAPLIVLCHDPDTFPYVPARASLTLAGHLHGGQVNLPVLANRVVPSRHGGRYKAGHVVEHGRNLFVSRGLGETGRAVRFRSPPEVPLLTLRSGG